MSNTDKPLSENETEELRRRAYQEEAKALREDLANYVMEAGAVKQISTIVSDLIQKAFSEEVFRTSIHEDLEDVKSRVSELRNELVVVKIQILQALEGLGEKLEAAEKARFQHYYQVDNDANSAKDSFPIKERREEHRPSAEVPGKGGENQTRNSENLERRGAGSPSKKGTRRELPKLWPK